MINKLPPSTSDPPPGSSEPPDPDRRLESWKEIAVYLRREVRTVQLWEKREGLPVHRHFHHQLGSVFALRSEIDAWRRKVSELPRKISLSPLVKQSVGGVKHDDLPEVRVHRLRNATGDRTLDPLCEDLSIRIVSTLQEMKQFRILRTTSASPSAQRILDYGAAQNKLSGYDLRWILKKVHGEFRLHLHLACAANAAAAWSHIFRSPLGEYPHLTDVVAGQVVQCLWLKLSSASVRASIAGSRERTGARASYLKGRYFWNQRSQEGLRKALHCFESAIQEDAGFAPAYSGLADSLTLLSFYEIVSPHDAMPRARRAAHKAIELDPDLAEGHASLADIFLHYDRDWQAADVEYRRSIQCNPGYALGYHWYANLLAARGQHEAARVAIMQALELDPVSIITLVWAGVTSHLAHRFDEAIRHYQNALELDSSFVWAHMYLAQSLEQKGNFNAALQEF